MPNHAINSKVFSSFLNNSNNPLSILSAEAINNYVLFPGEVFSFNKVVGKRTAEKRYRPATVIIKGEFSEDIGGGICQVSTPFSMLSIMRE
ncbi:VanW family protein [Bacillus sp. AFS031507]|uniref:VanW family protein n=1 Tax=Bacillaceae TaxID=186817 RepID=UPI0035A0AA17